MFLRDDGREAGRREEARQQFVILGVIALRIGDERLPGELSQLVEQCRAAKESLLADGAPDSATVTLLGAGSKLIGGTRAASISRDEAEHLVLDGFFPAGPADDLPHRARAGAGLVAFGLP